MCNIGSQLKTARTSKSEPFVGYRWFRVKKTVKNKATLHPIAVGMNSKIWNEKIAKANRKPTLKNPNGLYLFAAKKDALGDPAGSLREFVLGRVVAWGDCVIHNNGFRAEFAKIELLYPTAHNRLVTLATKRVRAHDFFGNAFSHTIHEVSGRKSLRAFLRQNKNFAKVRFVKLK